MKTSLRSIADLAVPRVCVACGRDLLPSERHICICCAAGLPLTYHWLMTHNPMADRLNALIAADSFPDGGFQPYALAAALFFYRDDSPYRNITRRLKYGRDIDEGKYFSGMLGGYLATAPGFADVDMVVPVPLHWTRLWKRGYNQAGIIAREIAGCLPNAAYRDGLLTRIRRTDTQTALSSGGKAVNVKGAFKCSAKVPQARHILLVDDVFTSGATMTECMKALRLKYGGTTRISAAALAFVE